MRKKLKETEASPGDEKNGSDEDNDDKKKPSSPGRDDSSAQYPDSAAGPPR